jgi:hypothetical protein
MGAARSGPPVEPLQAGGRELGTYGRWNPSGIPLAGQLGDSYTSSQQQIVLRVRRPHSSVVEHLICNQRVVGSNPSAGSILGSYGRENRCIILTTWPYLHENSPLPPFVGRGSRAVKGIRL